jgi:hypothetical protein
VPSEIAAWRWVLANTPAWSDEMHECLRRGLNSYAKYGTDDEKKAIEQLCGRITALETRMRILQEKTL